MINRLFFFIFIMTFLFIVLSSNFLFFYKSINALNNNTIIQPQQPLTKSLNPATSAATKVLPCASSSTMQCPLSSYSISPSPSFSSSSILTTNNNLSIPVSSISNSITNYSNQIANTLNATSCEQSLTMQCPPPPVLDFKFNNVFSTNNGLQALYLKQQNEMLALLQKQQQEQKDFLQKQFLGVFGNVFSQPLMSNITYPNMTTTLGINGKEDYSNWQDGLSKNYTNIMEGSNKITAKSSCLNNNSQNTCYSVNVTGMSPEQFKNYNHTTSTLNNASSLATIHSKQHPVALEIQKIREESLNPSQFAFFADNNNTNQELNGRSLTLNNTTPLVPDSSLPNPTALNPTALNPTAIGLNSGSIVPVVLNYTTFSNNNTTPLVPDSSLPNPTAIGLNSGSSIPVVSSAPIPVVTTTTINNNTKAFSSMH